MSLMNGQRQKIQNEQLELAFMTEGGGEALRTAHEGSEPFVASDDLESPARDDLLMEQICARDNVITAWQRVRANGGSPGVDNRSIDDTAAYLREHWLRIRGQVLHGTYQPQPVKRVKVPKSGGGFRNLGIPMAHAYCISLLRRLGIALATPTSTNSLGQFAQYSGPAVTDQVNLYKTSSSMLG